MARKKPVPQCKQHLLVPALMSSEKLVLIKRKTEKGEWLDLDRAGWIKTRKRYVHIENARRKVCTVQCFVSKLGYFTEERTSCEYLLNDNSIVQGKSSVKWHKYSSEEFKQLLKSADHLSGLLPQRGKLQGGM